MADRIIPLDAWAKIQGSPTPLGASCIDSAKAWNFALYSTEATAVRLVLYGKSDFVNPLLQLRSRSSNHTKPSACGISSWPALQKLLAQPIMHSRLGVPTILRQVNSSIPSRFYQLDPHAHAGSFCRPIFRVQPRLRRVPTTERRRSPFCPLRVYRNLPLMIARKSAHARPDNL